ncbi:hypothetical protein NDU88_005214 [Pleurodeles waltl]|uniref:Uncharacterized protein n=1 Tax=Pleurodeles waltl TaxID=8319 RepID=A0AAV7TBW3_PLEWA|nr:hypothetical protein NDU88_005214 [Pleurodeles waltl]
MAVPIPLHWGIPARAASSGPSAAQFRLLLPSEGVPGSPSPVAGLLQAGAPLRPGPAELTRPQYSASPEAAAHRGREGHRSSLAPASRSRFLKHPEFEAGSPSASKLQPPISSSL